jgi:WD40 repeat protein
VPDHISGYDWESVDYSVSALPSEVSHGEEVTAMDVSDRYLALQYFSEPRIDVFDAAAGAHLFSLQGHSYGGQCVRLAGDLLYSGSMDKTVRSWNLSAAHSQGIKPFYLEAPVT